MCIYLFLLKVDVYMLHPYGLGQLSSLCTHRHMYMRTQEKRLDRNVPSILSDMMVSGS